MNFQLHRGSIPLLVSIPHMGTEIPQPLRADYVARALEVEDTDWHLDRCTPSRAALGASVLQPTCRAT
jgi:N-formylglutamate deformylase